MNKAANREINMSIVVAKRQAGNSTAYAGLWIVTINGKDSAFPEPASEANDRIARINKVIERMRDEGQSDVAILGKYGALSWQ